MRVAADNQAPVSGRARSSTRIRQFTMANVRAGVPDQRPPLVPGAAERAGHRADQRRRPGGDRLVVLWVQVAAMVAVDALNLSPNGLALYRRRSLRRRILDHRLATLTANPGGRDRRARRGRGPHHLVARDEEVGAAAGPRRFPSCRASPSASPSQSPQQPGAPLAPPRYAGATTPARPALLVPAWSPRTHPGECAGHH